MGSDIDGRLVSQDLMAALVRPASGPLLARGCGWLATSATPLDFAQ
jgi:hypothetical protein